MNRGMRDNSLLNIMPRIFNLLGCRSLVDVIILSEVSWKVSLLSGALLFSSLPFKWELNIFVSQQRWPCTPPCVCYILRELFKT